jgi:CubicO group peptidase (beta-lactamase class C family)
MKDTGFAVPEAKRERLAACYEADPASAGLMLCDDGFAVQSSGSAGLFSTVDDYLALNGGRHGTTRILARPRVELMTTDQITPAQKAASPFSPGFWDQRGWGFGVSMIKRRDDVAAVAVLMVQRLFDSVVDLHADFWTLAYQAIDD